MTPFERELQRRPFRTLPLEWRRDILPPTAPAEQSNWQWRDWLWPSPHAWAALAAIWILVLGVNIFDSGEGGIASKAPVVIPHEDSASAPNSLLALSRNGSGDLDSFFQ